MAGGFRHEALLYDGEAEFLASTAAFVQDAVGADEPVLVALCRPKLDALRDVLGPDTVDSGHVVFADMTVMGRNPARIIPAWRDFLARHPGRTAFRGVGEPIWAGRSDAEIVECQRHEALLNVAFAAAPTFHLLCPYDAQTLPAEVISDVFLSHPQVWKYGVLQPDRSVGLDAQAKVHVDTPLPEPRGETSELQFDCDLLHLVRRLVRDVADVVGLPFDRRDDLVLAASELATNSVVHGGGTGTCRIWAAQEGSSVPLAPGLVCEIRDAGHIDDPLVGREAPSLEDVGHRGMWLVNQLCDLVQVRELPGGTVVRAHVYAA